MATTEAARQGVGFDTTGREDSSACTSLPAVCFRDADDAHDTRHGNTRSVWQNQRGSTAGQVAARAYNAVPE